MSVPVPEPQRKGTNAITRHFAVLLESDRQLDPERVVPALLRSGLSRADALRICRRSRGILLSRQSEEVASELAFNLTHAGIEATAVPEDELPGLGRPNLQSRIVTNDDGLWLPTLDALGKDALLPWDSIRAVVAGLIPGQAQHSLSDLGRILLSGASGHQDREYFAAKAFAEPEPFPLRAYLDRDPADAINPERLVPKKPPKSLFPRTRKRLNRFEKAKPVERYSTDHIGLRGTALILTSRQILSTVPLSSIDNLADSKNLRLFSLHGHEASYDMSDLENAGHWLRGFTRLLHSIVENSLVAQIPEETRLLSSGADSFRYLYYDDSALEEHLIWMFSRSKSED